MLITDSVYAKFGEKLRHNTHDLFRSFTLLAVVELRSI